MNDRMSGIKGLDAKEPVGAVLTVGHKGPKGNPTDTDRFFIVSVFETPEKIRPPHPDFADFNRVAPDHKPSVIHGRLVHGKREQAFIHHLKAQVLVKLNDPARKLAHPDKRPACEGDGVKAKRWNGKTGADESFDEIPCPNELCEFRKEPDGGRPTPCKPWMQILFRPEWRNGETFPSPLMKLTSGSWNNARAFLGFFEYIEQQAKIMGLEDASLYGLPFTLTLSRKTKPSATRSFPVMSIAPDGDLQRFLFAQAASKVHHPAVAALTDGRDWNEEKADLDTISAGIPREMIVEVKP